MALIRDTGHEGKFTRSIHHFDLPPAPHPLCFVSLISLSLSLALSLCSPRSSFLLLLLSFPPSRPPRLYRTGNLVRLVPTLCPLFPSPLLPPRHSSTSLRKRRRQACLRHDLHLLSRCMSNVLRAFRRARAFARNRVCGSFRESPNK